MEGIEILTKTAINEYPEWISTTACILGVIFVIGMILIFTSHEIDSLYLIGGIAGLGAALGLILLIVAYPKPGFTGRYRYEAVISDDVSINDIYEKYEVINKDGKKWILEDKERD